MLSSVVPRLTTDSSVRVVPGVWKPLFFKTPFLGRSSVPTSFVSLFVFYIFPYLLSKRMDCFFGCLMSFAGIQKLFCGIYSAFKCSFDEFVGEKVVSLSYSSTILGLPPRAIIEAYPFTTTQEVVEELNTGHSMIIQHLKQTGKVKELNKWVSHELTENRKTSPFKMSLTTMNHFWIRLWHMMKSEFCMITSDNQFSGWTEKKLQSTSQSQTAPKKDHGHCLVVCCSSNSLQLSESQWNHGSWEVCSADRWDAPKTVVSAASIDQQKGSSSSPWQCPTAVT